MMTAMGGTIIITCDAGSGQVQLDNAPAFACPGTRALPVTPGRHAVTFGPTTEAVDVDGDSRVSLTGHDAPHPSRALPWVLVGGGIALGLGGFVFQVMGNHQADDVDAKIAAQCADHGCTTAQNAMLSDERDSATAHQRLGLVLGVAGLAAVIGGVVLGVTADKPGVPRIEIGASTVRAAWRF